MVEIPREYCTFCDKLAVADVTLPGATKSVYACEYHLEQMKRYWKQEKIEHEPKMLPRAVGKEFTKVKLTKEMEEYLDKSYPTRQDGIRHILKAHMKTTMPMKDPKSEEIRQFLIRLYAPTEGVIKDFQDLMKTVGKAYNITEADVGVHLNNLMREEYLWREEDHWRISDTKRMFSGGEQFIREVVHVRRHLKELFGGR